jgi:hypothetical protein
VVVLFPLLRWLILRGRIPRVLEVPDEDTRREMGKLKDAWGGIFGSFLFLVTIALLVGLSAGGKLEGKEGVWTVTAPAALIMLTRDVVYDLRHRNQEDVGKNNIKEKEHGGIDNERDSPHGENGAQGIIDNPAVSGEKSNRPIDSTTAIPGQTESTPPHLAIPLLRPLQTRLPTTYAIISHLPLPLLPFAFSMFILVEALQYTGWIRVFGGWWAAWAKVGGVGGCIWLMGTIGVLGCNVW